MNKYLLSYIKLKYPNSNNFKFYDNSIIFANNGHKYVIKKNKNDYLSLYKYLDSRGFIYLPKLEYIDKNIYKNLLSKFNLTNDGLVLSYIFSNIDKYKDIFEFCEIKKESETSKGILVYKN